MKNLSFVKISSCVQLGHLYEHIYASHISTFFYERNIFEFIDYNLQAYTFGSGIILFNIDLYTQKSQDIAGEITTLSIDLTEEIIQNGIYQIAAEKKEPLGYTNYAAIVRGLERLQNTEWKSADDVDVIDGYSIRRSLKPLYVAKGGPLKTTKLTATLKCTDTSAQGHETMALFRPLAWAVGMNIQHMITDNYGVFYVNDTFRRTRHSALLRQEFTGHRREQYDLNEIADLCKEIVGDVRKGKGFERLLAGLQASNYANAPFESLSPVKTYQDIDSLVGSHGWKRIATDRQLSSLLHASTITIAYGTKKVQTSFI